MAKTPPGESSTMDLAEELALALVLQVVDRQSGDDGVEGRGLCQRQVELVHVELDHGGCRRIASRHG